MKELTRMDKDERKAEFIRLFRENQTEYFFTQYVIYLAFNGYYKPKLELNYHPFLGLGEKGYINARTKVNQYLNRKSGRCPSVFVISMLINFIEEIKK